MLKLWTKRNFPKKKYLFRSWFPCTTFTRTRSSTETSRRRTSSLQGHMRDREGLKGGWGSLEVWGRGHYLAIIAKIAPLGKTCIRPQIREYAATKGGGTFYCFPQDLIFVFQTPWPKHFSVLTSSYFLLECKSLLSLMINF